MHQFFNNIFQNNRRPRQRQSRTRPAQTSTPANSNNNSSANNNSSTSNSRTDNNNNNRTDNTNTNASQQRQPVNNPFEAFAQQFQANFQQNQAPPPQQHHNQHQEAAPPTRAAPPADSRAIRQLPTVSVTPEDLVDENNRECCICFEEHCLNDKVTRLPCAHIYHPRCITEWLNRHCTCPQCRYELPTDNVVYERERKQRMKNRKPRYARYELERMSIKELKGACVKLSISMLALREKKDFVDALIASGKIILIAAPEPVEYQCIEILRSMGVGQLKRAMADAGVFFDGKDVVEKEDMVQIFVSSGRIVLVEKDSSNLVDKGDSTCARNDYLDPYGNEYSFGGEKIDHGDEAYSDETKRARVDEDGNSVTRSTSMNSVTDTSATGMEVGDEGEVSDESDGHKLDLDIRSAVNGNGNDKVIDRNDNAKEDSEKEIGIVPNENRLDEADYNADDEDNRGDTSTSPNQSDQEEQQAHIWSSEEEVMTPTNTVPQPVYGHAATEIELPSFAKRSIGNLRQLAASLNVDLSGCIEKGEIVTLIMTAIAHGGEQRNGSS
eukprot:scaffold253_cov267-Chaetoceros_neogracile.AAC.29